ncbi:MAG TPA: UDP-N-acetylmuramate--L-alanine ligase [bacterium]
MQNKQVEFPGDIYLMGIAGVGMGNLAGMLKSRGVNVRGSDKQLYPPMKEYLEGLKIDTKIGFSPENLLPAPDIIIVGNVISRDNPEVQEMRRRGIPFLSMAEAIRRFFLMEREVVVVAGTHGKTTSTAMLGWLLASAGRDPSVFLGGVSRNFNSGFRLGKGKYFVIEGDEYDTAFFDKGPKFLHYNPENLLLTTVEFDHGDIYESLDDVKNAFKKLIEILPNNGYIAYGGYSPVAVELLKDCRISSEGFGDNGLWQADDIKIENSSAEFTVLKDKKIFGRFRWKLIGNHNITNCLGAIAIADRIGLSVKEIAAGIESFRGVKRRQEIAGEYRGILLIDDFAHHPTEVRETISAVKLFYPERRLWAVFEPRSNTSRRNYFQKDYPSSFKKADITVISGIYNPDALANGIRLNPQKIVKDLCSEAKDAFYKESVNEIVDLIADNALKGDIVLIMSNGSFGDIVNKLKNALG